MKRICVFCGSSQKVSNKFFDLGKEMGAFLADQKLGLVYGGASVGLMGVMADTALEKNGKVWGVIPQSLVDWEVAHANLTDLKVVGSMHERKKTMYDLSDAFVALPGGMGTLDELCEIITWAQLRLHKKPCFVFNHDGFFDHLMEHFRYLTHEGFLSKEHLNLVTEVKTLGELGDALEKRLR